jgi:ABC-type Na+ efflux pump permease subunit
MIAELFAGIPLVVRIQTGIFLYTLIGIFLISFLEASQTRTATTKEEPSSEIMKPILGVFVLFWPIMIVVIIFWLLCHFIGMVVVWTSEWFKRIEFKL